MDIERTKPSEAQLHPTLLGSGWRYRWLILACVLLATAAAALVASTRPVSYQATSAIVVEDPRSNSAVPSVSAVRADRYVLDQLQVLRSSLVATQAAQIMEEELGTDVDPNQVLSSVQVAGSSSSDLIAITYTAATPELAQAGAGAVPIAYQRVVQEQMVGIAATAFDELDRAVESLDQNLAEVDRRMAEMIGGTSRQDLELQLGAAIDETVLLQAELATTTSETRAEELRQRLRDIRDQLTTLQLLRQVDAQDPERAALAEERQVLIERRAALAGQRNELLIGAELAGDGVSLYSPPAAAVRSRSIEATQLLLAGMGVGGLVGVSIAYLLAGRNRIFSDRAEPEILLGAPLLTDVPDFDHEGLDTQLPTRDALRSAAAEAYRFAAAGLDLIDGAKRSLAMVSALNGTGKTTAVANLGVASARKGLRVLLVDSDFGNQSLSQIFLGSGMQEGITEVVAGHASLTTALNLIPIRPGLEITLLSRGRMPTMGIDFFRSEATRQVMKEAFSQFDVVLIDTPPFLQVAYSATVCALADGVVVVVDHESKVDELEQLHGRLAVAGVDVVGYVYNRAPLRREMTILEGSMRDVVGDQGWTSSPSTRRDRSRSG